MLFRSLTGEFGGRFVPESLVYPLEELTHAYTFFSTDKDFQEELTGYLSDYAGRPSPLSFASRLTQAAGGGRIFLKREDLNHTGSHKINNTLGQVLLAQKMGKTRVIAETGAGQHGVATATACALFGMECCIYMGSVDVVRQRLNVFRMEMLGAEVRSVDSGSSTLKDAINEAMRDWVGNIENTHYVIGSVVGPDPYPRMVGDFQSVIGNEARSQMIKITGGLPAVVVACVGGGSNAMGMFRGFLEDEDVKLLGVEAAGEGLENGKHAASLCCGEKGILHGTMTYLLQDEDGQIQETHSVAAGLDYPGVGPEHSLLCTTRRAEYTAVTDREALEAFLLLSRKEGIIPALESAHAVAKAVELASGMRAEESILVCLSGRGDKDVQEVAKILEEGNYHG